MAMQDSLDQLRSLDVSDLDINNIGSWPGAVKVILMVLLFAAVCGAGYYLHITDKQKQLDQVVAEVTEVNNNISEVLLQAQW